MICLIGGDELSLVVTLHKGGTEQQCSSLPFSIKGDFECQDKRLKFTMTKWHNMSETQQELGLSQANHAKNSFYNLKLVQVDGVTLCLKKFKVHSRLPQKEKVSQIPQLKGTLLPNKRRSDEIPFPGATVHIRRNYEVEMLNPNGEPNVYINAEGFVLARIEAIIS